MVYYPYTMFCGPYTMFYEPYIPGSIVHIMFYGPYTMLYSRSMVHIRRSTVYPCSMVRACVPACWRVLCCVVVVVAVVVGAVLSLS